MKFIASSDHHWDEHARWDECVRVHRWMVELVERERPDAFLCAGDIYERASTPKERRAVADWLTDIAEVCPVVIVKGNHDQELDCALMGRLHARHSILVVEGASVCRVGDALIACMAWPERSQILRRAHELDSAAADEIGHMSLQNVMRSLGAQLADPKHTGPRIGLGHFMVDGAHTSVGQPLIGMPMNVGLADLALLNASVVVMGHIHKPQAWQYGTSEIVYCGSPYRTSFGEVEDKSVLLMEFDGAELVRFERVQTPCAGMVLVYEEWDAADSCFGGGPEAHVGADEVAGAEIRLRYAVDGDQRVAARAKAEDWAAQWMAAGAAHVKIEEAVRTTVRARAPEVARARTLGDKLLALWESRGTTPEPDRREQLLSLATDLERESAS